MYDAGIDGIDYGASRFMNVTAEIESALTVKASEFGEIAGQFLRFYIVKEKVTDSRGIDNITPFRIIE